MSYINKQSLTDKGVKRGARISNPCFKRLYTLKEAAEYLGRSEYSMRELIWSGQIRVVMNNGGRKIFVDIEDLEAYVEENKVTYH